MSTGDAIDFGDLVGGVRNGVALVLTVTEGYNVRI